MPFIYDWRAFLSENIRDCPLFKQFCWFPWKDPFMQKQDHWRSRCQAVLSKPILPIEIPYVALKTSGSLSNTVWQILSAKGVPHSPSPPTCGPSFALKVCQDLYESNQHGFVTFIICQGLMIAQMNHEAESIVMYLYWRIFMEKPSKGYNLIKL